MVPHIITDDGVTVILDGKPVLLAKEDPSYAPVTEAIRAGASAEEIQDILTELVRKVAAAAVLSENIRVEGGMVLYKDEAVNETLSRRILQHLEEGFSIAPMVAFLENLMLNPSARAVETTYPFLEFGKCPITEDGHFLAYKKIKADYTDIYTGKCDNSPGQTLRMPRNRVNEDPDQTCSYGLHVCSFSYLAHFGASDGDRVVVVKVNPRDVVAVPRDYENTKMRVCEYHVLEEYTEFYRQRQDRLALMTVAGNVFQVEVFDEVEDEWNPQGSTFEVFDEALEAAQDLARGHDIRARVLNLESGTVVCYVEDAEGDGQNEDDVTYRVMGFNHGSSEGRYAASSDDFEEAVNIAMNDVRHEFTSHVIIVDDDDSELARFSC